MATASVSITPECSICCENLKTPKVLTCGHTYCLDCIDRYIGDKKEMFLCPICGQDIKIPEGGAKMFTTNFILQTFPHATQVTGTPTSPTTQVTGTPTSLQTSEITDQPVTTLKHHCPNHSKKEVEYYCQTCSLRLCSKCIYRDHNDHKTLDLECDSTREMVVEENSKSEQFIKNIIEDMEKTHAALLETSEKLKSFCDEACKKIREKTEKIIGELEENCEKKQKEIRDNFDKNESQLIESRQKVMIEIKNIKIDLDTSCLIPRTKLQDLQKLCENMKTDIPPVTYVEWREGSVKVGDILGSTETKPLYQTSEGSGPISTVTKPLHLSRKGCGPIATVKQQRYQSTDGKVFICNYKDIRLGVPYYSEDKYESSGPLVWSCRVVRYNRCLYINFGLLLEDNPTPMGPMGLEVKQYEAKYTVTLLNEDEDKNVIGIHGGGSFVAGHWKDFKHSDIQIPSNKLIDPSEGFIDNAGQFYVRFDLLFAGYRKTLNKQEQQYLTLYGTCI